MSALKSVGWPLTKKWKIKNGKLKMGEQFFIFNAKFLILLAFILRVFRLGSQSLWFDEGWSWHLATMPLAEMIEVTAGDRSPVLYYGLLHGWMGLVGQSEFAMRYLSVFADVVTLALLLAFGRGLMRGKSGPRWGYSIPALLWAVSPMAIWFAQETRMYALVGTFCMASSYALWRWVEPSASTRAARTPWLITSASCLAAAIHSHYYAIFLLPAHGCIVLGWAVSTRQIKRYVLPYTLAVVGIMTTVIPWLIYAARGFAYSDGFVFPLNTIDGRLMEWARAFISGGFSAPSVTQWQLLLGLALALQILAFAWLRRWRALMFVLAIAILPLLSATIAVRLVYPYKSVFHARYLIYAAPALCLLFAAVRPRLSLLAPFALLAMWLPNVIANYTDPNITRDDTRAAVQHITEALAPGDVVVMQRDNFAAHYYGLKGANILAAPKGLHGTLTNETQIVNEINTQAAKRVRLMLWQDDVVDPQRLLESTLWANGFQIGELNYRQIRLPLFQVQSPLRPITFSPITAQFGEALALNGVWLRPSAIAGDWFYVVLRWQPLRPIPADYKVFIHVIDATGKLVFQRDKLALSELMPMSAWPTDQPLRDPYAVVVPADLPAGEYRVVLGVYDPTAQNTRLPATINGQPAANNAVQIGTVKVESGK